MRFAYIDSQGNEVPIPGVDALALRIELGAIGPDTELYDSAADRWGPAHTHEIFHTLSRREDEEFAAPPPPVAPSTTVADERDAEGAPEASPTHDPAPDAAGEDPVEPSFDLVDEASGESPATPPSTGAPSGSGGLDDLGIDFSLADSDRGGAPTTPEPQGEDEDEVADFSHLAATDDPLDTSPLEAVGDEAAAGAEGGAGEEDAFDFGGFDTLEMEGGSEESGEEHPSGMDLEQPLAGDMEFDAGPANAGGGLDFEQPMSDFSAEAPPAWMQQDGPAREDTGADSDDTMGFDPDDAFEESPEPDEPPRRPKREPLNRPSPPKRPSRVNVAGPLIGVLLVGIVGAAGWFGWQAYGSRSSARQAEPEALPPVTLPDIPVELLPTMRSLGERALAATSAEFQEMAEQAALPIEPRDDWLAGIYLANAADYPDVEEYWSALDAFVERLRDEDAQTFHDRYLDELQVAGIQGDTAALLLERADSGFLATREDRWAAYAGTEDLINASLDLHAFLAANGDAIDYTPATGGMASDPVLQAVPATRALGDEMWNRVDRITGALDALGTLDRVTTERLLAVLFDRIRRAGFQ